MHNGHSFIYRANEISNRMEKGYEEVRQTEAYKSLMTQVMDCIEDFQDNGPYSNRQNIAPIPVLDYQDAAAKQIVHDLAFSFEELGCYADYKKRDTQIRGLPVADINIALIYSKRVVF